MLGAPCTANMGSARARARGAQRLSRGSGQTAKPDASAAVPPLGAPPRRPRGTTRHNRAVGGANTERDDEDDEMSRMLARGSPSGARPGPCSLDVLPGRPQIDGIYRGLAEQLAADGVDACAVLACGPRGLVGAAKGACMAARAGAAAAVDFEFHSEEFEW